MDNTVFTDEELAIYEKVMRATDFRKRLKRRDEKPVLAIRFKNAAQMEEFVSGAFDLSNVGVFYTDGLDDIRPTHLVDSGRAGGRHRAI